MPLTHRVEMSQRARKALKVGMSKPVLISSSLRILMPPSPSLIERHQCFFFLFSLYYSMLYLFYFEDLYVCTVSKGSPFLNWLLLFFTFCACFYFLVILFILFYNS